MFVASRARCRPHVDGSDVTEPAVARRLAALRLAARPTRHAAAGRAVRPADDPTVVARRRHLPGLRPELRRRQRRRHRRPRRRPVAAALPARPRRRRDLVHAVVRLAARRRRLRRRRLPGDRPGVRHARRGRGADRRGARARDPDDHRRRPEPRLRPARLVPGRPRRRPGLARARALLVPPGPGRRTATSRRPAGRRSSRAPTWTRTTNPDGTPGEWYLHLFTAEQPDLNWDHPDVRARARGRSCASGSTAAPPASASTRRRCWSRTRRCPRSRRPGAGRAPAPRPRRAPRHLPRAGGRSPTRTPATRVLVGEVWLPDIDRFARYLRPDELHTAFNFDFMARPWDADEPARVDRRDARRARAGRRAGDLGALEPRRHPARSPATAARTPRSPSRASGSGRRPTSSSAGAGPGPPRCSPRPCPARSTSTRATSSGSTRSRTCRSTDPGPDARPLRRHRPGRDGCRVPLPWAGDEPPFGFSPAGAPRPSRGCRQPAHWAGLTVEAAGGRPGLDAQPVPGGAAHPPRRARPRRRPARPGCRRAGDVLAFAPRRPASSSVTNLSGARRAAAAPRAVLLASADVVGGHLPPDATVWLRPDRRTTPRTQRGGARRRAMRSSDGPEQRRRASTRCMPEHHGPRRTNERRETMTISTPTPATARLRRGGGRRARSSPPAAAPREPAPSPPAGRQRRGSAAPSAAAHEPVTITVGVLRPGATQEAVDALNLQISEFEAKYPWITVEPEEYNWTAPTFTAALAGRHAAGRLHDPVHRRQGPDRPAPDRRTSTRASARSATPTSSTRTCSSTARTPTARSTPSRPQAYGMSLTYNRTLFTQAGLDPTSRRRRGTRSAPPPRRSPTRPASPATPRWPPRTPAAGS